MEEKTDKLAGSIEELRKAINGLSNELRTISDALSSLTGTRDTTGMLSHMKGESDKAHPKK